MALGTGGVVVFNLQAVLGLTTKDFEKGLNDAEKTAQKKGKSIGEKLETVGKATAKGVGIAAAKAGAAMVKLIGDSFSAASSLEQNLGGAEAVFGDFSQKIVTQAQDAYKIMGLSEDEYLAHANKMGSLFQGSGMTQAEAWEKTTGYMQRAADVASIMGIDVSDAMTAVEGAAKGNFTMMDNLGVAMNATTLEAYALSKGMKVTWADMSNAQKEGLAYEMFMEQTAQYAGNYAKENKTLAGSFTTLKAAWHNFMADPSTKSSGAFTEALTGSADVIIEKAETLLPALVEGLGSIGEALGPKLPGIITKLLPSLVNGVKTLVGSLAKALPGILQGIMSSLPAIASAAFDIAKELITGIVKGIGTLAQNIWGTIKSLFQNVTLPSWTEMKEKIAGWWNGIKSGVSGLMHAVFQPDTPEAEEFRGKARAWWNGLKGTLSNIFTAVFGVEPGDALESIRTWWEGEDGGGGVKAKIGQFLTAGLSILGIDGDAIENIRNAWEGIKKAVISIITLPFRIISGNTGDAKETIRQFWEGEDGEGGIKGYALGLLKLPLTIAMESGQAIAAKLKTTWDNILSWWGNGPQLHVTTVHTSSGGHEHGGSGGSISDYTGDVTTDWYGAASEATGLSRVPYSGFKTTLHKDEMVLNAREASAFRKGGNAISAGELAAAVASAISGLTVSMDGETVGRIVTPSVSRNIARGIA